VAALILSVIGFSPLAQDVATTSRTPELPECCRAHGKHKCGMRILRKADAGPAIYSRCDQYPPSSTLTCTAVSSSVFPPFCSAAYDNFAGYLIARADRHAVVSHSLEGSHQKRGPPTFLS